MFLEQYELGELIAESERNTVRRARRSSDGRRVIIKTSARPYPSVRDLRKLAFEHHLLEKLAGPGVIEALGIERQSGRVALVLEDFGGERLPVRPNAGLPLAIFFPLALGIVRALAHVHAKDVTHKDINPRNVLMNPSSGEVKLIDFSLSSELSREHPEVAAGTRLEGTLPYISPEQTGRMNRDVDYRSDYYSLGVTFFELLTGTQPFAAPDVLGYVHQHLSKAPPSARERNPAVPAGLAALVAKLMAKNPDDRYQSARGLSADLEYCQRACAERGDVEAFVLAAHDVPERFGVSRELVGRESEVAELLAVFEGARSGPAQLLLVAGYSGVGKSSLIRELHAPVVDRRASFVSGKFEQLERNTPYGALLQALRELCKQMLTAPEQRLLALQQRLSGALGSNAGVLTPLLPELAQILGPVPAVAELPAREARGRLQRAFRDLLRAVATPEHPLVVFLDDLQWSDGSTPQLLVRLIAEENLRHVLFIGAFRDNEVGEGHLLSQALAELERKRPGAIRRLSLAALGEESVNRIVASTLRRDLEHTRPLASLLFQKTAGNPFFLSELMNQLHREGAIRFDPDAGAWASRDDAIARASYSDNVVDLMLRRIQRLPPETIECLRLAACLGNEFELGLLSQVAKRSPELVAAALWPAAEQRLLLPRGHDYQLLGLGPSDDGPEAARDGLSGVDVQYRFPHDRVHAAVYSLSSAAERARAHLDVGRSLQAQIPAEEHARRVFEFVDHLNLGRSLLEGAAERDELAQLDYAAAQRARRSAAYATAVAYLEASEQLLTPEEWQARRARHFEIQRMRAECVFLSGQVDEANALAEGLFARAPDTATLAAAYCLKAQILEQQSRLAESVATILRGLRELGLELPEDPAAVGAGIGAGIGKMKAHLDRTPIESLSKLPSVTDPLQVATTELLFQLIPPASQLNPPLFILAELVLFDLALTHGTVPGSAKNFMDCGIVLGSSLGDYAGAYRMGKEAFTLLDRIVPTPLEAAVNFVFGCFISHWGAHFQEGVDALARAHQRGVELGDVLHASYAIIHRAKSRFFAGRDLAECQAQADRALAYTLETGSVGHVAVPRLLRRALGQLTGQNLDSDDLKRSDEEFTREIEKTENGHFLLVLGEAQAIVSFVLGDLERAAQAAELATRYIGVGNGAFTVPDYHLFQALIQARRWAQATPDERPLLLAGIEGQAATLEGFARVCPANFAHKHLLVRAELARLRQGSIDEVLELHRQAQQAAGDDFVHLRAISYELLAGFWIDRGHPQLARESLLEAYHLYRHWGAAAKLRRLERDHSDWLRRAHSPALASVGSLAPGTLATITAAVEGQNLDIASVIKATHAISSEVKPERLFSVLIQTIIENAGAQHGFLFVRSGEGEALHLAARASVGDGGAAWLAVPLERCPDVAQDVVRYVARSHETLVLDDASLDKSHGNDPHVKECQVRSLLCMPVLEQGRLLAVLYAENNATPRAFTPSRLVLLRVIAGQAAISIANAELYAKLEDKVAERTRQLVEQSREVAAMLESLEQGVFTIDAELRVQPRYSRHLEQLLDADSLAGKDCLDLLFTGSDVGAERLANMRAALEFSFGSPLVFAEPNKAHWVREFQRSDTRHGQRSFELDWTPIAGADDVVTKILIALRDVTLMKQLRANAMKHARELDIVGQILDAGVEHFHGFVSSARALLSDNLAELAAPASSSAEGSVFRNLHTIKGNARLLGLSHLASSSHTAEEHLDERHRALDPAAHRRQARAALELVLGTLAEYEQVCQRKLGAASSAPAAWHDGVDSGVAAQIAKVKAGALGPAEALAAIDTLLQRASAVPFEQIVKASARVLPMVALEVGKVAPRLEVEDRGPWLSAAWVRVLKDCLIHVFQNSLDHGIEAPDERRRRGKPEQGTIYVRAERTPRGATLRFWDDGRGLALAALRERAAAATEPDEVTAQTIFDAGVSTARRVTQTSGRGIGLDAVRALVRGLGGELEVALRGPSEAGFRPFELVFSLPIDAVLSEKPSSILPRRSEPPRARSSEAPPASQ